MSKSMFWCFTVNNDPRQFWTDITDKCEALPQVKYLCGQLETASTGQLHFQGYVQLSASRALSWLKNNIDSGAHFERQKGTNEQARDYCCKVDETTVANTFIEYGTFKAGRAGAGARNDIHTLRDNIINGATQREIIENNDIVETFATHLRFADRVRSLYRPKANDDGVKVILYFGSPGTGKTRKAFEDYPNLYEIPISNGTLWLDGYDLEEEVLFDDFMGGISKMTLDNTLKFFDRYVRRVPVKGSHVWYKPKIIVVTSNYHPRAWYKWEGREESWAALKRRFHEVYVFESDGSVELQDSVNEFMDDRDLWPQMDVNGDYQ